MRKNLLLAGGIAIVIVVILAALAARLLASGVSISQKTAVSGNFAAATSYGQNTALTSNGSQFVARNYTNDTSQTVSASAGTNGLRSLDTLSVSTDKRYILFHVLEAANGSLLATTLENDGLDTSLDYWWLYDSQAQTYRPLPQGTLLAKLRNGHLYTLSSGDNGESIISYAPDTLNQLTSVSVVPSTNFEVTADGYLLQNIDNNIYFTKDGVINRQLSASSSLVTATADNRRVVVTRSQDKNISLLEINLQTGASTILAKHITNQPLWQSSGLLLYNTSSNGSAKYFVYDINTKKATAWNFSKSSQPSGDITTLLDAHTAVATDTSDNYYLVGDSTLTTTYL